MMKFKKFLAAAMTGAMMFGMVATAAPAVSVYAADASTATPTENGATATIGNITLDVNYRDYTATISTEGNDQFLFLHVMKVSSSGNKEGTRYCYPLAEGVTSVTVDLSFLSSKKEQCIQAYGSSAMESVVEIKIPKQSDKIKVKYAYNKSATDGYGHFKNGSTEIKVTDAANYVYHTSYNTQWKPFSDLIESLETNTVAGTTVVVRAEQRKDGNLEAPPSPEVKVKIAAIPKAPKIKTDYAKGTVAISDKYEYQVVTTGSAVRIISPSAIGWTKPADDTKSIAVETLRPTNETVYVAVRQAADKKAASNITFIPIEASPVLDDTTAGQLSLNGKTLKYKTNAEGNLVLEGSKDFEWREDDTKTWAKVKGTASKPQEVGESVQIRFAGVKTKGSEKFPSVPKILTALPKATAPTAGSNSGEIKIGSDVVATIARDTNGKIQLTVTQGKETEAATLEYLIDEEKGFEAFPTAGLDNADKVTIKVRVKESTTNAPSSELSVEIAAKAD